MHEPSLLLGVSIGIVFAITCVAAGVKYRIRKVLDEVSDTRLLRWFGFVIEEYIGFKLDKVQSSGKRLFAKIAKVAGKNFSQYTVVYDLWLGGEPGDESGGERVVMLIVTLYLGEHLKFSVASAESDLPLEAYIAHLQGEEVDDYELRLINRSITESKSYDNFPALFRRINAEFTMAKL